LNSLRDILPEDREMIRMWRNDPEVRKYMFTDHEIGAEEHRAWFDRMRQDTTCKYWIVTCDGEDAGLLYLYDIDQRNRHCYWGFYTSGPNVRGKGIGSFAEFTVMRIVFDEMQLQKLCGLVLVFNQVILNLHKKFGFVQEGLLRKHILKGGELMDVISIGMLREEWDAKKSELALRLKEKGIL
jgi:UDP-4-amino-4,6-dideoxy-N-acetyl-beta-L-altrosamine N-acetyltransferase